MNAAADTATATQDYIMSQTMLRVRDPQRSLAFYRDVLGMTLLNRFDFAEMKFSLYFVGYLRPEDGALPEDPVARAEFTFNQKGAIELTHNWGTESDDSFTGYHNGNADPRGFGHIGITVPDVYAACERFEALGVEFVKRPDDGKMKGLAFIKDPDGYWIEVLSARNSSRLAG
ncbi:lactoylglutathione lyase [Panacagrimonas sp.]|uniref:lactoylglutathione lyase n=1 Tax=Panacagrimonas sp. TaxID=2480088 RepID=UPI003B51E4DD